MIEQLEIDRSVRQWLNEAADLIQTELKMARYQVSQKTGPTDLVTTVDQQIEVFFCGQASDILSDPSVGGRRRPNP